jgi:hypothetical protein
LRARELCRWVRCRTSARSSWTSACMHSQYDVTYITLNPAFQFSFLCNVNREENAALRLQHLNIPFLNSSPYFWMHALPRYLLLSVTHLLIQLFALESHSKLGPQRVFHYLPWARLPSPWTRFPTPSHSEARLNYTAPHTLAPSTSKIHTVFKFDFITSALKQNVPLSRHRECLPL